MATAVSGECAAAIGVGLRDCALGGNTGIGKETAVSAARQGAEVYLACRSKERGDEAVRDIMKQTGSFTVHFIPLDLNSMQSVRECAHQFLALGRPLHCLVNNAGIMALQKYSETADGIEKQWGVNHIGHFLLTLLLLPALRQSAPARIINLSSTAHAMATTPFTVARCLPPRRESYSPWQNYGVSKLSNILFTRGLAKRLASLPGAPVAAYAVHPGVVATELGRNNCGACVFYTCSSMCAKTPQQGASTTMHCALVAPVSESGRYYADCAVAATRSDGVTAENDDALWALSVQLTHTEREEAAVFGRVGSGEAK